MNPLEQPTIRSRTPQLVRQTGLQSSENAYAEFLSRALQRLRPDLRRIFLLREVERQSYHEISVTLGISEAAVGTQLNIARRLLIQYLTELGWQPTQTLYENRKRVGPFTSRTQGLGRNEVGYGVTDRACFALSGKGDVSCLAHSRFECCSAARPCLPC